MPSAPPVSFEQELARELVQGERLRVTLLAGILAGYLGSFLVLDLADPHDHLHIVHDVWRPAHLTLFALPVLGFNLWVRWRLGLRLAHGKMPRPVMRYVTSTVETCIPTVVLLMQESAATPMSTLGLPASYGYFLLIALATLHLSFWLCLYTGVICAVQYLAVGLLVVDPRLPPGAAELTSPVSFQIWKALFMVTTGVATGIMARRVYQGVENSIRSVEARRRVLDIFGKHVSPQVVEHLLEGDVALGGETRRVCVLFLDIRDFTAYSSGKPPEQVVAFLNGLFDFMIDSINRHRGIVNKFLGDGFMAIFGAPLADGRECQHAVAAAREILERLAKANEAHGGPPTRIGIGIHVGAAVAGSVGSAERREYTIIGDTVNLASRIEALNKQFHSQLLVSEAVWRELGAAEPGAVALGPVAVKGKEEPVTVYQLA